MSNRKLRIRWTWIPWVAALVAAAAVTCAAADEPESVLVRMNESYVIGGHTFAPGTLAVSRIGEYTPTLSLHEIRVDGERIGLLMARRARYTSPAEPSAIVFVRLSDGSLHLSGYVQRAEDGATQSYVLSSWGGRMAPALDEPLVTRR